MKIDKTVLTAPNQGLPGTKKKNARDNIDAQVKLDASSADSHISLVNVTDADNNVVSQTISVTADVVTTDAEGNINVAGDATIGGILNTIKGIATGYTTDTAELETAPTQVGTVCIDSANEKVYISIGEGTDLSWLDLTGLDLEAALQPEEYVLAIGSNEYKLVRVGNMMYMAEDLHEAIGTEGTDFITTTVTPAENPSITEDVTTTYYKLTNLVKPIYDDSNDSTDIIGFDVADALLAAAPTGWTLPTSEQLLRDWQDISLTYSYTIYSVTDENPEPAMCIEYTDYPCTSDNKLSYTPNTVEFWKDLEDNGKLDYYTCNYWENGSDNKVWLIPARLCIQLNNDGTIPSGSGIIKKRDGGIIYTTFMAIHHTLGNGLSYFAADGTLIDGTNQPVSNSLLSITTTGHICGEWGFVEGCETIANYCAHAEGYGTTASGGDSHAEGRRTKATGYSSHAEGEYTTASGYSSHAEGEYTTASGYYSHAEGYHTTASGDTSHAEGEYTTASGVLSHAEGSGTTAAGQSSHAGGEYTSSEGVASFAHGYANKDVGGNVCATGYGSVAIGYATGNHNELNTTDQFLGTGWVESTGGGAFAVGYADGKKTSSTTHASPYSCSVIGAYDDGAFAAGYAADRGWIEADWDGDIALGAATDSGCVNATSGPYGIGGAIAMGCATNGAVIDACSSGTFAIGYADGDSSDIEPSNTGAFAMGAIFGADCYIESYSGGALAFGCVERGEDETEHTSNCGIQADGKGSVVMGYCRQDICHGYHSGYDMDDADGYMCADGEGAIALGRGVFSYGDGAVAIGDMSFAMGAKKDESQQWSPRTSAISIGTMTQANGNCSVAMGYKTQSTGKGSFAEGIQTTASNEGAHAEGKSTTASGYESHAEGKSTTASNSKAHAEGDSTTASGDSSHAEGISSIASGYASHAEGNSTIAEGYRSHSEGSETKATGLASHSEGYKSEASNENSHAEGNKTIASGANSHSEGTETQSTASNSHAEGNKTIAEGSHSHAEGTLSKAIGIGSHAEGNTSNAVGTYSHAEGSETKTGENAFASHAEGYKSEANGSQSHAEGNETFANGRNSHAEGENTIATGDNQHVFGKYNIADAVSVEIVGWGSNSSTRANIRRLASNGNEYLAGDIYLNGSTTESVSSKLVSFTSSTVGLGLVPKPTVTDAYLASDGTWQSFDDMEVTADEIEKFNWATTEVDVNPA